MESKCQATEKTISNKRSNIPLFSLQVSSLPLSRKRNVRSPRFMHFPCSPARIYGPAFFPELGGRSGPEWKVSARRTFLCLPHFYLCGRGTKRTLNPNLPLCPTSRWERESGLILEKGTSTSFKRPLSSFMLLVE